MWVRQARRPPSGVLSVTARFAASLLSRARIPSSSPLAGARRLTGSARHGRAATTWTCRRCGAVAADLAAGQRHIAAVHRGDPPRVSRAAAHAVTARFPR
jgi:hypothetical protein